MKYVGKVLKIVYDVFVMGCVVLTACIYYEDIKDVLKNWFD